MDTRSSLGPRTLVKTDRVQLFRSLRTAFSSSLLVAFALHAAGCKIGSEKKPQKELSSDAVVPESLGFDLQDLKELSGKVIRVSDSNEVTGPTLGHGVLASESLALAPGFECKSGNLVLHFVSQGNEPVVSPKTLKSQTRNVKSCQSLSDFLAAQQSEDKEATKIARNELQSVLAQFPDFQVALLSFDGGLPSSPRSWSRALPHANSKQSSAENEKITWEETADRFVVLAGFSRDASSTQGPFSRRIWFPMRAKGHTEGNSPFVGSIEMWITSKDRSPLPSMDSWLKGPEQNILPGIVFSGVSRFANVRPFSEIETPDPKVLCFVLEWVENKEAPEEMRFSARCLKAAPIFSALE